MKHLIAMLTLLLCIGTSADAQSFTERLQKSNKWQGKIEIHQSNEITQLVNGSHVGSNQVKDEAPAIQPKPVVIERPGNTSSSGTATVKKASEPVARKTEATTKKQETPVRKPETSTATKKQETATAKKQVAAADTTSTADDATGADSHKKVVRNAYKVNGYRVQIFAGGNTRKDRQKAEQIGNEIKSLFPTEPVYVHFYSPRWICRMGNYRTYEEAHAILTAVKEAGYDQASIVKGKISVAY
ncbi:MAG: SPOR domain-containing protein [Prevotella sp.]